MVTTIRIGAYTMGKVFFDTGSGPNILYYHTFKRMNIDPSTLFTYNQSVTGFNGVPVPVMGTTKQPVVFGDPKFSITIDVDFLVVDVGSSYNVVFGRSTLCLLKAVVSQPHLCLKFPTPDGVGIVKGDQLMAKECYHTTISWIKYEMAIAITPEECARGDPGKKKERKISTQEPLQSMSIEYLDQRPEDLEKEKRTGAVEPVEIISAREGDNSKTFRIGA